MLQFVGIAWSIGVHVLILYMYRYVLRFARARVSLSCKCALPCSGRRCVCANVSLVSVGAPRHVPALPAWGKTPGLCFWRALDRPISSGRARYIPYLVQ